MRDRGSQQSMRVLVAGLSRGAGHPFYERLSRCVRFYTTMGQPGLAPDLDAIPSQFGADRRAIAPPTPSASHLNTEDSYGL